MRWCPPRYPSISRAAGRAASSARRACVARRSCASAIPHLDVEPLRGNVNTRLRKLDEGQYAAIILAAAGLKRLGFADRIAALLDPDDSLPAVGQGALAIECRADRADVIAALAPLADARDHARDDRRARFRHARSAATATRRSRRYAIWRGDRAVAARADREPRRPATCCAASATVDCGRRRGARRSATRSAREFLERGAAEILAAMTRERSREANGRCTARASSSPVPRARPRRLAQQIAALGGKPLDLSRRS